MARPIWSGVISFGLVSVPVGLFSATRDHDVSFHQFEQGTGDRIRYQRVNESTGKEVDYSNIVRGAEVGDGEYVMLDQEELDSVAPGRSRSLEIHGFVDQSEIDPVYYQKTYYLAPGSDETKKTYALLRDAMSEADRVAIGTLVMRGKEYLAAVRPAEDLLVLETMFFSDEIRDPHKELSRLPGRTKVAPPEMKMARQLIDSMSAKWEPQDYQDSYTDRVKKLIDAKKRGKQVTVAEEAPAPTNVIDLMEVLRRSVDDAKTGRAGRTTKSRTTKGRTTKSRGAGTASTAAKKTAAKTTASAKKTATKTASAKKTASAGKSAAPKGRTSSGRRAS